MKATLVIYKDATGKIVEEIPIIFWFSGSEEKIEDRHFNIEHQNVELMDDESAYIKLPLSLVLDEIKRFMRGN